MVQGFEIATKLHLASFPTVTKKQYYRLSIINNTIPLQNQQVRCAKVFLSCRNVS